MTQPTPYEREYDFNSYQASSPSNPLPGSHVDAELNRVKTTLDQTLSNLALIQRDDTALANASVGIDQLKAEVATGWDAPTQWVTATAYTVGNTIFKDYILYYCAIAHTSGVFATDLAAVKWVLIEDFTFFTSTNATTTAAGIVELATDAEAIAKASTSVVLTASNLAALGASSSFAGLIELASDAEALAIGVTDRAVTPGNLGAVFDKAFGVSLYAHGGTGDGTTDDTNAVTVAMALAKPIFVQSGLYDTTHAATALDGKFWGLGQIRDASDNLRAPFFSLVDSAPSSNGTWDSVTTAFNGDLSRVQFAVEHRITGTNTLTHPATGYVYVEEAYPHVDYLFNSSGWNNATASSDGRTAAVAHRVHVYQGGQGDAVAFNVSGFVTGARAGATDFLANPAVVGFNGDFTAGQAGVYLNPNEVILHDGSFDVAGIGYVTNLDRNVATGALGAFWTGFYVQSVGSADVNAAFGARGKFDVGLDFSHVTMDANKAAIAIKAGDRIYFESSSSNDRYATALGDTYLSYDSGVTGANFVVDNVSVLQLGATLVLSPVDIRTNGVFKVSTLQVVGARSTGWGAMTGTPDKATAFDTATVTLAQLAGRVMSLQAALTTHGLLGT